MNSTLRIALGAAAVIAVVLAGVALMPRSDSSVGGPGGAPSASPSPTPTPSPTATAASSPAVVELPGYSALLAPGDYFAAMPGGSPKITFTLPERWISRYSIAFKDRGGTGEIAFGLWVVDNVYTDPCRWTGALIDPPVGPTGDDLATALTTQKRRNASPPTDVTLGGYPAKRIELSIPANLDKATCDKGVIRTWVSPGEDPTAIENIEDPDALPTELVAPRSGQLNVVYIVDIDGARAVIDTWHMPGTSAADLAELDAILASMRIGP